MQPYQIPVDYYSAGVHCAQCSVHIPDPWFDKLNKKPNSEASRIQKRELANSTFTRLACCVQIRPELNEMICVVGDNVAVDGDWFAGGSPGDF